MNRKWLTEIADASSGAEPFAAKYIYYANGNILSLTRYKEDNSVIDQLSYAYTPGSNKLASVTDAVGTTLEDWDAESSTFACDGNQFAEVLIPTSSQGCERLCRGGNVIEILENGVPAISAITYDHRNLPVSLIITQ